MEFYFQYNPSEKEKTNLVNWYNTQTSTTIEQHPFWPGVTNAGSVCLFYATEKNEIVCSAIIEESNKLGMKSAEILFGPLFNDSDIAVSCIDRIYIHYKKKGFTVLTVQLGTSVSSQSEYIEYKLHKIRPFKTYFDRNNWSSTTIDLNGNEDDLLRKMSKGHKSDIKKAQKEGLSVIQDFSEQQFSDFVDIYTKMHRERRLAENNQGSSTFLNKVLLFFREFNAGTFLLVLDKNEKVIGGIALVYQNKIIRYFKGAADPDIRNLPVLHLAIWEGIKKFGVQGFSHLDLWGYNHFVTESDQIFFINRFKKGFGGSFIFYPRKMYYVFKPLQYKLYNYSKRVYKKLRKDVRIRRHN